MLRYACPMGFIWWLADSFPCFFVCFVFVRYNLQFCGWQLALSSFLLACFSWQSWLFVFKTTFAVHIRSVEGRRRATRPITVRNECANQHRGWHLIAPTFGTPKQIRWRTGPSRHRSPIDDIREQNPTHSLPSSQLSRQHELLRDSKPTIRKKLHTKA